MIVVQVEGDDPRLDVLLAPLPVNRGRSGDMSGLIAMSPAGDVLGALRFSGGSDVWEILRLEVAPQHRQRGIGRSLMAEVERRARTSGVKGLRVRIDDRAAEVRDLLVRRAWCFEAARLAKTGEAVEEAWIKPLPGAPLRVALIGANPRGRGAELAEALGGRPDLLRLVAIVDPNAAARAHWESVGLAAHVSADELARNGPSVRAAILAVPHHAYPAVRRTCIEQRWAMLHEKPLACSLAELLELSQQLSRQPTSLVVGVQRRHHPSYVYLRDAIAIERRERNSHGIETLSISMALGLAGPAVPRPPAPDWRSDTVTGGALLDVGYHAIDLAHFLLDAPLDPITCTLWVPCSDPIATRRPALGDEVESAAVLVARCGPTWVRIEVDRAGAKHERAEVIGCRRRWVATRDGVTCDGTPRYECPTQWSRALGGQFARLVMACMGEPTPLPMGDHLSSLRVVEAAYGLRATQGLGRLAAPPTEQRR